LELEAGSMNAEIRRLAERIARLEEQRAEIAADIADIKAEAKGQGYDCALLMKCVRLMLKDTDKRKKELEQHELFDTYLSACGLIADRDEQEPDTARPLFPASDGGRQGNHADDAEPGRAGASTPHLRGQSSENAGGPERTRNEPGCAARPSAINFRSDVHPTGEFISVSDGASPTGGASALGSCPHDPGEVQDRCVSTSPPIISPAPATAPARAQESRETGVVVDAPVEAPAPTRRSPRSETAAHSRPDDEDIPEFLRRVAPVKETA
jgi:uncharacterized protein (UPF0335 family)